MTQDVTAESELEQNKITEAYTAVKRRLTSLKPAALMRRDHVIARVAEKGFPTTRNEDWRYSSLRSLLGNNFQSKKTPQTIELNITQLHEWCGPAISDAIRLVFIDGDLSLAMSDTRGIGSDISIKTLLDAESQDEIDWKRLDGYHGDNYVFSQLAIGLADHGLLVKLSPRMEHRVIHVLHIVTEEAKGMAAHGRLVFDIQKLAQVSIIQEFVSPANVKHHHNDLTQFLIGDGAQVQYLRIVKNTDADQTQTPIEVCGYLTSQVSAKLGQDSKFECTVACIGKGWNRMNIDVAHQKTGSECSVDGVILSREQSHVDFHTKIVHESPDCITKQMFKSILKDKSRFVFNGKVIIPKGASGSSVSQNNKNLLLSNDCEVNTKPELMIDNNDVKATHGAAIGALNPNEVFYLQTRGIPKAEAESILSRGFADEVTHRIQNSMLRNHLNLSLENWFAKGFL